MLQHVIHSLLLLPENVVRQLLHQLLTLLPQLDLLTRMIPDIALLEQSEFDGSAADTPYSSLGWFVLSICLYHHAAFRIQ